jgi:hypothetical protein
MLNYHDYVCSQDAETYALESPAEMYETISQFYPLPPLNPDDHSSTQSDSSSKTPADADDASKMKTNPPYDMSAGKATPFVTLAYLTQLYSLPVDAIIVPGEREESKVQEEGTLDDVVIQKLGIVESDGEYLDAKES